LAKVACAGIVNFNPWPKFPNESAEDYFRRLHKHAGTGTLAPCISVSEELSKSGFGSAAAILAFWKSL
jgi:hypothetical protein